MNISSAARLRGVLTLALALALSQTAVDSPESVRQFVDQRLMSFEFAGGWNARVRQGSHSFTLTDENIADAFTLVPEAHALALSMTESYQRGMRVFRVGTAIEMAGAVGALALLIVSVAGAAIALDVIIGLALGCAGLGLAGAVVSLFAIPDLARAQAQQYEVVATYNHGLTRLPVAPGLQVSF